MIRSVLSRRLGRRLRHGYPRTHREIGDSDTGLTWSRSDHGNHTTAARTHGGGRYRATIPPDPASGSHHNRYYTLIPEGLAADPLNGPNLRCPARHFRISKPLARSTYFTLHPPSRSTAIPVVSRYGIALHGLSPRARFSARQSDTRPSPLGPLALAAFNSSSLARPLQPSAHHETCRGVLDRSSTRQL